MKKMSEFLPQNFQFLVVKFSIYMNRRVFVMRYSKPYNFLISLFFIFFFHQTTHLNLYRTLGRFCRWNIFFFLFCLKIGFYFHANCLLMRQLAWNVKSLFSGKHKKYISKCHLLKYCPACDALTCSLFPKMFIFWCAFALKQFIGLSYAIAVAIS